MKKEHSIIQQAVTFRTEQELFGLPVMHVNEIILTDLIRPVTTNEREEHPSPVVGVIHLRGKVIPILSFRRLLGKKDATKDKKTRIIIVSDEQTVIGLLVDEVSQVMNLTDVQWDAPPKGVTDYVFAVCKHHSQPDLIYMVEAEKLLKQEGSGHV